MINTWIEAFIKPQETFTKEKANASFGGAALNLAIAAVISAVLAYLFNLAMSAFSGVEPVVLLLPLTIDAIIVFEFIYVGVIYVIARLLGGNGGYVTLLYFASLYAPVVALLGSIPLVSILVGLYSIYLFVIAVKESQNISTGRAAVAVFIPLVLLILMIVFAAVLVAVLVGSAVSSQI